MTIRRLSIYSRCLAQLEEDGVRTVSSHGLAERFHLNSAQVRKDLAHFGEFGIRGIGYYVATLRAEIQKILGLDREWRVVLVGFGNLGSALFRYRGFVREGFRVAAIVDDDPAKAGRQVDGLVILPLRELPRAVRQSGIQMGVIAVPAEAAQLVADCLVAARVRAILNFAPARLKVPRDVRLQNVDLSIELENLSFHLAQGGQSEGADLIGRASPSGPPPKPPPGHKGATAPTGRRPSVGPEAGGVVTSWTLRRRSRARNGTSPR